MKLSPAIPTLSRVFGVSQSCARRLVKDGLVPAIRVGRQWRVDENQLAEWVRRGGAGSWKQSGRGTGRNGAKPAGAEPATVNRPGPAGSEREEA